MDLFEDVDKCSRQMHATHPKGRAKQACGAWVETCATTDVQAQPQRCAHGHTWDQCRCHEEVLHSGQDKSIYKQNSMPAAVVSITAMRKKSEGRGLTFSCFVSEEHGFCFDCTGEEMA